MRALNPLGQAVPGADPWTDDFWNPGLPVGVANDAAAFMRPAQAPPSQAPISGVPGAPTNSGAETPSPTASGGTGSDGFGIYAQHAQTTQSGTTTSGFTTSGSSSTSPFVINVTWDASVASAPAGFTSAVMAAVQFYETQFVNPITVNLDIGWGEVEGYALGSQALGMTSPNWNGYYSASQMDSYLTKSATSTDDQSAYSHLPGAAPAGTPGYWVTSAQAKALGMAAGSSSPDAYIGFSSYYQFDYNNTDGVSSGTYDLTGVAEHEISHALGRVSGLGPSNSAPSVLDMFRYSAPGAPDFSYGTASYFSTDGGLTDLNNFSVNGENCSWTTTAGDSYSDAAYSGVVNGVSGVDLTLMDVLGYARAGTTTAPPPAPAPVLPPSPTAPTGISVAALATSLSNALAVSAPMANVTQVGGTSGDAFTYTLGGTGASAFLLNSASNVGTLMSGVGGLPGSTTGTLYTLNVTANDVTNGTSSPAAKIDVIVGTTGNDSISVATLSANLGMNTPTFIYGRGGNDSLDGSKMTGNQWFVGGGGADAMTAGTGADTFVYGATSDSTASAMDVISGFSASMDKVDLSGLGTSLQVAGSINSNGKNGNTLAAHSIGWQNSGGNTFVYVNASGGKETVGATDMKIELLGSQSLSSSNFGHI